jgi:mannose-6-phosphate isomerase-like protein (cupin superfamily)
MEIIKACDVPAFSNSGVISKQLLFPENSKSQRVTITRVVIEPGAVNPPHKHETSEQVWVALQGSGRLLLEEGKELILNNATSCASRRVTSTASVTRVRWRLSICQSHRRL